MSKAYNKQLLKIGSEIAEEMGINDKVHTGVYTCLGGPNYETVAELRMLRMLGVDAVGKFSSNPLPLPTYLYLPRNYSTDVANLMSSLNASCCENP